MLLTTKQAAARLGITRFRVHQLIWQGILPAEKWGRDYQIKEEDLEQARARRTKPGRPAGQQQA